MFSGPAERVPLHGNDLGGGTSKVGPFQTKPGCLQVGWISLYFSSGSHKRTALPLFCREDYEKGHRVHRIRNIWIKGTVSRDGIGMFSPNKTIPICGTQEFRNLKLQC